MIEQRARFRIDRLDLRRRHEQAQRMHRLPQVMTGGGEEARLRSVRLLGNGLFTAQVAHQIEILEAQLKRFEKVTAGATRHLGDGNEPQDIEHAHRHVQDIAAAEQPQDGRPGDRDEERRRMPAGRRQTRRPRH